MTTLTADQFGEFFEAVHGYLPFPWQARLARQVMETGRWPRLLDLPTGTGKTACLDIAVFALAASAGNAGRTAPTRTMLVVDRRTIVDQTHARAMKIRKAVCNPDAGGVVASVRDALSSLSRERHPLQVAILRGGIARDDSWARSPDQPLIGVSTVDQVGSRLLFRGYGVSGSMRPVHAGLLGNDTLFLLDEVHLSQAFCETLAALQERYKGWSEKELPARWQVVQLSATPGEAAGAGTFSLDDADRADEVLQRRLSARKPVRLLEPARIRGAEVARPIAEKCAELISDALGPGMAIGVVVNRVLTAQAVAHHLRKAFGEKADVVLVTGRMRPLDRVDFEGRLAAGAGTGRNRAGGMRPFVVVSTQCIEAGADLDFDVMVTECASLDALRQRFGRLNRLGEATDSWGAVLLPPDAAEDDPVYGGALLATWRHLSTISQLDLGIDAFGLPDPGSMAPLLPARTHAPILLPAHIDTWAQTGPEPEPEPEVALWLHGPRDSIPEVQIIWRADISENALRQVLEDSLSVDPVLDVVEACPPGSVEALSVPLSAARRWLREYEDTGDFADVEGETVHTENERRDRAQGRPVVRWLGEHTVVCFADSVRPGDTIVVPAAYGGLRHGSWYPAAPEPVMDLGDRGRLLRTGRPLIRLHHEVLMSVMDPDVSRGILESIPKPLASDAGETDDAARIASWLERVSTADVHDWLKDAARALLEEMASKRKPAVMCVKSLTAPGAEYFVLAGRRRHTMTPGSATEAVTASGTTEDDTASFAGSEITLRAHLDGVRSWAEDFAVRCGLPEPVAADISLAAGWHDIGKADPRFQILLHGGSEYRARVAEEPIAKSSRTPEDRAARELARAKAKYPPGYRHEALSAALLQGCTELLAKAADPDLVLHLLTSHHGHGRPLVPVVEDKEPVDVEISINGTVLRSGTRHGLDRLDSGVCDRFWRLNRRYGWWGLAWMEAILRLADHRRSAEEQRASAGSGKR